MTAKADLQGLGTILHLKDNDNMHNILLLQV